MTSKAVSTRMSVPEIVVAGLAIALLMSGLATGVLAKQAPSGQQPSWQSADRSMSAEQRHRN